MTEFTGVGKHCSAGGCNQQDFLPFKCDCCSGFFCLPHRGYREHACPSSGEKDFRALVCPLCKKAVRFADSQDPNVQWALHSREDCNPQELSAKKAGRKRCAAASCKETLGPTNTQRCSRCARETCLTHRFPDSHNCAAARVDRRMTAASAARARQAQQARPMSLRERAAHERAAAHGRAAAQNNTVRATAERRRVRGDAGHGRAGSGSNVGEGERCPQCGAVFPDVGALVAHTEVFHSEGGHEAHAQVQTAGLDGATTSRIGAGESCPICQIWVADAALLVSHVQVAHPEYGRNGEGQRPGGRVGTMMSDGAKNCAVS